MADLAAWPRDGRSLYLEGGAGCVQMPEEEEVLEARPVPSGCCCVLGCDCIFIRKYQVQSHL